ncbi:3-dehydroquinate synthase [Shimazuella sp. AN120528]|uniref:3-dehydroquinate synthase n=1 Tax=Shimazuella soli TaxID=1892854 RepID=UPI001F0E7181|nr:3-dehydroquinate synthase [Shimazuella soli]MCH5585445.1 3-dehydroquinate synthase [Shimazuella soli]
MRELQVQTKTRTYSVYVGVELLSKLPSLLSQHSIETTQKLFLVTDSHISALYAKPLLESLRSTGYDVTLSVIPAGESSKSLETLDQLYEEGIKAGLDRSSVVIALGGGVVGDLAGFFAASFMRGIPFIQLPTTLLAHDSSIGGKVGINHRLGKNYMGAFHQPLFVLFDVSLLSSLPVRELTSGFAEVVKHALIWDKSFVSWLVENNQALKARNLSILEEAIYRGCKVKISVVSEDETEKGKRAILNYGHTIGHALESISNYSHYTHGEAISIGMVGAAMLSVEMLDAPAQLIQDTESLLQSFSLPTRIEEPWSDEALLQIMKRDKKAKQGNYTFVLSRRLGNVEIVNEIPETKIKKVLKKLKEVGT